MCFLSFRLCTQRDDDRSLSRTVFMITIADPTAKINAWLLQASRKHPRMTALAPKLVPSAFTLRGHGHDTYQ